PVTGAHAEHRGEAAVVADREPALAGDQQRLPAVGLRPDSGQELGVDAIDGSLGAPRRRARGARRLGFGLVRRQRRARGGGWDAKRDVAGLAVIAEANAVAIDRLEPDVLRHIL